MRRMLRVAIGVVLAACAAGAWGQAGGEAAGVDAWSNLAKANNLDIQGNTPFHLGMSFQLFDIDGKPTDMGKLEAWWTGTKPLRTVVHLEGLDENGSALDATNPVEMRNAYLVGQLLYLAMHPVEKLSTTRAMATKNVSFGKVQLDCLGPKSNPNEAPGPQLDTACFAKGNLAVLLLRDLDGNQVLIRNKTGKFHDTFVSLDVRLGYMGKDAIEGNVTAMQSYAATTPALVDPAADEGIKPGVARVAGGVIAGQRIKFTEPIYPGMAKARRASGSVWLRAIISTDGTVKRVVPIAATDSVFTDAAAEAVSQGSILHFC